MSLCVFYNGRKESIKLFLFLDIERSFIIVGSMVLMSLNFLCSFSTKLLSRSNFDMGIIVRPTKDDEFNFSVGKISLSNSLACDRARSFYILFFFEG